MAARPYVAVASYEGLLVNQHLGESESVYIYEKSPNGFKYVEQRVMPLSGGGDQRWINVAKLLKDCRALLVGGVGPNPKSILKESGLHIIQMTGMIDEGLEGVYDNKAIRTIKKEERFNCGSGGCKGDALGCG
ncbi:MAG: NifB/NifX family molybdenum-iron cluster-binding protein [Bacteroidaceae bacterium]|nr:hypothetical protein [Bacteroidaceae bacterium]